MRYGRDFDSRMGLRNFAEEGRGYGADYQGFGGYEDYGGGRSAYGGTLGGMRSEGYGRYGGMRSDAEGGNWRGFAGEEGWYGAGYEGYPGGEPATFARGYDLGYGGRWGGGIGYGAEYEGGYGRGTSYVEERGGYGGGWGEGTWRGRQSDADRLRASDIMTEDPVVVTPHTSISDVAKQMRDLDVGIIPVVDSQEDRRLQGVVTDRDMAIRALAEGRGSSTKVLTVMTTEVEAVNKNDSVRRVMEVMKREKVRRVPVTDRDGRLVGIIAQADLAGDYAALDLQRETEVAEVIERISEPAEPRRRRREGAGGWRR